MKKGFFFTMDSTLALVFLLLGSVVLFQLPTLDSYDTIHYKDMYFNAEDAMQILSLTKLSDLNDTFVDALINETHLEDEDKNKTLVDICGLLWSVNQTEYIENITKETFSPLLPPDRKYTIKVKDIDDAGGTILYNSSTGYHNARTITSASRIISGYKENVPFKGYTARSTIMEISKETSKYLYFGGFIGQGNITKTFTMPLDVDTVKKINLEMNTGDNFTIYINNNYSGNYSRNASQTSLRANLKANITNPTYLSYIQPDENNIHIVFLSNNLTRSYIGGGFIKVSYNTTQLNTAPPKNKYNFPGIDGVFNIYSSFFVPGQLNNMTAFLHYYNNISNTSIYLKIANATVFQSNGTGEQSISIDKGNLSTLLSSSGLDYNMLSSNTIPIRFGYIEGSFNQEGGYGATDAVLITDVSGSMDWRIGYDNTVDGTDRSCNDPNLNLSDTRRLSIAKCVDKDFVNAMLNATSNQIGLVSFSTSVSQTHDLSTDKTSLTNQINTYDDSSLTCICCGINKANELLTAHMAPPNITEIKTLLIENKSNWSYNKDCPLTDPPNDGNGRNWKELNYNDTTWSSGNAILGFENVAYAPNINTDIGNNYDTSYIKNHIFNYTIITGTNTSGTKENTYTENGISLDIKSMPPISPFHDGFETYYGTGAIKIDGNDINRAPGYWFIDDTWQEVYIMANQGYYPAYNGTDVLVFRDMDSYGYAETTVDLTQYDNPELSYWWRLGPNGFDYGEYANVRVWDGSWHDVAYYNYDDDDHTYRHAQIDLSGYNKISNFIVRFGCKSSWDDERFYVDDIAITGTRDEHMTKIEFTSDPIYNPNNISVKIKVKTNTTSYYDISVFDYANSKWEYGLCENKTINPGVWSYYYCNITDNEDNYLSGNNKVKIKLIGEHNQTTSTQFDLVEFKHESSNGNYYFRKHFTINNLSDIQETLLYVLSDDNAEIYINNYLIDKETAEHKATYWNRPKNNTFYDGFETYYGTGAIKIDGNDINTAPGYWFIDDTWQEVYIMANQGYYPAYNGTDVLVFRDMDSYGYAETTVDLTQYDDPELSYWWRLGPSNFESWEYANVRVWDGSWHDVAYYDTNDDDHTYRHAQIDLSGYNKISNFLVRFGCRSGDDGERFYIDDVKIKGNIKIPLSYLVEGKNIVSVKLNNNDSDSAKFDLQIELTKIEVETDRIERAMLVMSDGEAGTHCSMDPVSDHDQDGDTTYDPQDHAIQAACDAREYNIKVYAVSFGPDVGGQNTLRKIACWDCTAVDWLEGTNSTYCPKYYQSSNADELKEIYLEIAESMVNLSYVTQLMEFEGSANNTLYPDSYIYFNHTPTAEEIKYKEVTVTVDREEFGGIIENQKNKTYPIPSGITVLDARVTSYSSDYWTDRVYINNSDGSGWQKIYNLSDYGPEYRLLGDPYIVNIPSNVVIQGENLSIQMNTGINYLTPTNTSPDNRMIYTFKVPGSVGYGEVFSNQTAATEDAKERLRLFLEQYGITMGNVETYEYYIGKTPWMFGPAVFSVHVWE
ncbi:MAG: VWA domain-containing protein [Candidatus Aenigmarchaeota archaeon]|nr:VWA domain-containing protein [Candidatus Aenigmarchaeota archaeon]